MTVTQLVEQLLKLDPDTEVWVDTPEGLLPVDMAYEHHGPINTVIISYTEQIPPSIYKDSLN